MDALLGGINEDQLSFPALKNDHAFNDLKQALSMKLSDKASYIPHLNNIQAGDFPEEVMKSAISSTVGDIGHGEDDYGEKRTDMVTDAQKRTIFKNLTERKWTSNDISPQIIRDLIYYLKVHSEEYVENARKTKEKEKAKPKKEKTIEEENIGTTENPHISENFMQVIKGNSNVIPKDVVREVENEIKDDDRRILAQLIEKGHGPLSEDFKNPVIFPIVFGLLKRLSAAFQKAYLKRANIKTDPRVLEKIFKQGDEAEMTRRALKETGDSAKALRSLEGNLNYKGRQGNAGGGGGGQVPRPKKAGNGEMEIAGTQKRQAEREEPSKNEQHCFSCGSKDHLAPECPTKKEKGDKCFNCNEYGHLSKECTKPKRPRRKQ